MTQNGFSGDVRRHAGWFPASQDALEDWLAGHRERIEAESQDRELHPAVADFQRLIASDPIVAMHVSRMIAQVPETRSYSKRHLKNPDQMLRMIDAVLTMAPEFGDQNVTLPLGAILDWTMGTPAGFAAFRDPKINAALKKILTAWCDFLNSSESLYVLNDSPSGWTSEAAREAIGIEQYEHEPADPHWGFTSWNDFFTRRFRDGVRPVEAPEDDSVIVAACESTSFSIRTDVKRRDKFWQKSQPYSLEDLLANDETVEQFVGGTVYQAFLSATNYHRWHSPVAGTIVRAFLVDGTYYSEADSLGSDATDPTHSQGYLAHVATRAVFIIRADNPRIGLVAFVPVGMSEVSSCVIHESIEPGRHIVKGEELGYFQFGGSTHSLVFGPEVIGDFAMAAIPQPHDPDAPLVRVRSRLASVAPQSPSAS
jgi:phosphatidylserine decarboxylase